MSKICKVSVIFGRIGQKIRQPKVASPSTL